MADRPICHLKPTGQHCCSAAHWKLEIGWTFIICDIYLFILDTLLLTDHHYMIRKFFFCYMIHIFSVYFNNCCFQYLLNHCLFSGVISCYFICHFKVNFWKLAKMDFFLHIGCHFCSITNIMTEVFTMCRKLYLQLTGETLLMVFFVPVDLVAF